VNFYVTFKTINELKKNVFSVRKQHIIDIQNIFKEIGYTIGDENPIKESIINKKIEKSLLYSINRNIPIVIYSNPWLTEETVINLLKWIESHNPYCQFILLTNKGENEDYYKFFDRVLFFLEIKKMRIFKNNSLKT
jgi:hypothetical protein